MGESRASATLLTEPPAPGPPRHGGTAHNAEFGASMT